MAYMFEELKNLSDKELAHRLESVAGEGRANLSELLALIGEADRRGIYIPFGMRSMFEYCVKRLHFSEPEAYRRIHAARAARHFSEIYSWIADGYLSLTAVSILAPHLTPTNKSALLNRAQGKSIRELQALVAELAPRPDTTDTMRRLPQSHTQLDSGRHTNDAAAGSRNQYAAESDVNSGAQLTDATAHSDLSSLDMRKEKPASQPIFKLDRIQPSAPERVQFSFTGSGELLKAIRRIQELLHHKYPSGRLEEILLEIARTWLRSHDPELCPANPPRSARITQTRMVPAWVRSAVWRRDRAQCSFVGREGKRCGAKAGLELDHIRPWSLGGQSDDPDNIRLLCRTHHRWVTEQVFYRQ